MFSIFSDPFLYISPLVLLTGTATNIFTIIVFIQLGDLAKRYKGPGRSGFTIYIYLCILAVLDLSVLYFGLFIEWINQLTNFNIKNYSLIFCRLFTFSGFFFAHCSSIIMVVACSTRFIAVFFPLTANKFVSYQGIMRMLCSILLLVALFNMHYFWNMTITTQDLETLSVNQQNQIMESLNEFFNSTDYLDDESLSIFQAQNVSLSFEKSTSVCEFLQSSTHNWWNLADKLVYSIIPFILLLIFNVLILRNISKCKSQSNNVIMFYSSQHKGVVSRDALLLLDKSLVNESVPLKALSDNKVYHQTRITRSDQTQAGLEKTKRFQLVGRRFTIMLVSVSIFFLVTTLPAVVIFLLTSFLRNYLADLEQRNIQLAIRYYEILISAQRISIMLMYINHSSNFFVYMLTSSRFRQQFKRTFLNYSFLINFSTVRVFGRHRKQSPSTLYD